MTAPRPEPVLHLGALVANWAKFQAAVVGLIVAAGPVVVLAGWATQGQVEEWAAAVGGICGGLGTLLAVLLPLLGAQQAKAAAAVVREQVSGVESPQNVDGHALVDAEYIGRHAARPDDDHSANMAG